MYILIIDNDLQLINQLQSTLQMTAEVDVATCATDGLQKAHSNPYDVFLLNIDTPKEDEIQICKKLRNENYHVPLIILSKSNTIETKLKAFEAGANDFLVKPFEILELKARIKAFSRYLAKVPKKTTSQHQLSIDPISRTVSREGKIIQLRKKEFDILHYMIRHEGKVITRNMLIDYLWGTNTERCSNMIDVHFNYLRQKIDKPFKQKILHTVHGIGYVLKCEQ